MMNNLFWLTEKQDMETALNIIEKYKKSYAAEVLSIIEIIVTTEKKDVEDVSQKNISVQMSEWLKEIQRAYTISYGFEHGMAIFITVLTKILLKNQTVH